MGLRIALALCALTGVTMEVFPQASAAQEERRPETELERYLRLAIEGRAVVRPQAAQRLVRQMPVGETIMEQILDLVRACRPEGDDAPDVVRDAVGWGPGPRAAQALMLTVRARALLQGRLAPSVEDIAAMAAPVLTHRMALTFAARARGQELAQVIGEVTERTTKVEAAA